MKKVIFTVLILFVPFFVNARSYFNCNDNVSVDDKYITMFPNYHWYIDSSEKYIFDGTNFSANANFKKGAFLNESEINISKIDGRSYLLNGRSFWTMTPGGKCFKYVDSTNVTQTNVESFQTGARIVEYVNSVGEVVGLGTYAVPWEFKERKFFVDIVFDQPKITRENVVQTDGIVEYGDIIEYIVKVTNNGPYTATVHAKEVELKSELGYTISLNNAGNSTATVDMANKLMGEGLEFDIASGETKTYSFKVKVIGNAGQVIENLVLYSVDGIDTKPDEKNKTPIEKRVSYIEVKDTGANVVLALDDSGSMSGTKMTNMKAAAVEFINSLIVGDTANYNNKMCIVSMNRNQYNSKKYVCQDGDVTVTPDFLLTKINGLTASGGTPYDTTLSDSLVAIKILGEKYPQNQNFVIFLSDGVPNSTNYSSYVTNIKNYKNTLVYTIGYSMTESSSAATKLKQISSNYNASGTSVTTGYFTLAGTTDIAAIFRNISSKINEEYKRTESGAFQISGEIDRSRKLAFEIEHSNGSKDRMEISFAQAINQNYLISSGTMYEIDITKFNPDDKITVTYFLKNE